MKSEFAVISLSVFLGCTSVNAAYDDNDSHPLQGYQEAKGNVLNKIPYDTANDKNTLLLTESGYYNTRPDPKYPEELCMNKEIYVWNYKEGPMPPLLTFKLYDFIHDCPTSARLEFSKEIPQLTDLDGDGKKEVWIGYYKGCHGDVSPDELKVFMYLDGKKHSIRGLNRIYVDGGYLGGDYKLDQAMSSADKRFKDYGIKLFKRLADVNK